MDYRFSYSLRDYFADMMLTPNCMVMWAINLLDHDDSFTPTTPIKRKGPPINHMSLSHQQMQKIIGAYNVSHIVKVITPTSCLRTVAQLKNLRVLCHPCQCVDIFKPSFHFFLLKIHSMICKVLES